MLATWLLFAYSPWSDRPLKGAGLVGAGFVYGVLVLGVSAVVARWRARSAPEPPTPRSGPRSRKKRR